MAEEIAPSDVVTLKKSCGDVGTARNVKLSDGLVAN